jgi:hypothetical protein
VLDELRAGRTPSPDVLCNSMIKFGAFLDCIDPGFNRVASERVMIQGDLVAVAHQLEPAGYVLVPMLKELPPVKAFSASHRFSSAAGSLGRVIAEELHSIGIALREVTTAPDSKVTAADLFDPANRRMWGRLSVDPETFGKSLHLGNKGREYLMPIVTAQWGQGWPFNMYCPTPCGEPSAVGCVATAAAQVIRYWQHPAEGTGSHSYLWDGDGCGEQVLTVDFSDPYDWENMARVITDNTTTQEAEAVAELNYEVGVAFESTYGRYGTGAQLGRAVEFLPEHLGYSTAVNVQWRSDFGSDREWFEVFREQLALHRPVLLALKGYVEEAPEDLINHAVVIDGYSVDDGLLVHINMGWQHQADDWYVLNNIVTGAILWLELENQHVIRDIFPAHCLAPPEPTGFEGEQAVALSESSFSFFWDPVDGVELYELSESTDSSFKQATRHTASEGSISFSQQVDQETTFYYRVRSLSDCGPGMMPSPWSETLSVTVVPPNPSEVGEYVYIVPGIASSPGSSGTEWHSDLSICNMTYWQAELLLTFRHGAGETSASVTIPMGQMTEWQDVVESLFGLEDSSTGAVEISANVPLLVTARTFNQGPGGTFGQYMQGCTLEDALSHGVTGVLPQIRRTADFRTNIGLVNLGDASSTVRIRLWSAEGDQLGTPLNAIVPPGSWVQRDRVFSRAGVQECQSGFATVEVIGADDSVWAYASVIDNRTGDPTTVPVMVP